MGFYPLGPDADIVSAMNGGLMRQSGATVEKPRAAAAPRVDRDGDLLRLRSARQLVYQRNPGGELAP